MIHRSRTMLQHFHQYLRISAKAGNQLIDCTTDQIHIRHCLHCGGESGDDARVCDFSWIQDTMNQCVEYNVAFHFHQTGYHFRLDNRIYHINRKYQHEQAAKARVDFTSHK